MENIQVRICQYMSWAYISGILQAYTARICISNHHKSTVDSFYEAMKLLHSSINPETNKKCNFNFCLKINKQVDYYHVFFKNVIMSLSN